MAGDGEHPILDFVKRSTEEQKRLFDLGLSKCDGTIIISAHQFGKAADICFVKDGKLSDPVKGFDYWHQIWESKYGGKSMIDWDKNHFE